MQIITAKIEQISARGRVKVLANTWLDNPAGLELQAGRIYQMKVGDNREILEVAMPATWSKGDEILCLYREIGRLTGIIQVAGINPAAPGCYRRCAPDELGDDLIEIDGDLLPAGDLEAIGQHREELSARHDLEQDPGASGMPGASSGLEAISRNRDMYTGADGRRYISAGKVEHYDRVSGKAERGETSYEGI